MFKAKDFKNVYKIVSRETLRNKFSSLLFFNLFTIKIISPHSSTDRTTPS